MFITISLKNIVAHKKKSITTLILTALTTSLLIISTAFMEGSHSTMIKSAVEIYPSYIQITHKNFREQPGLENLITEADSLLGLLHKNSDILTAGARFETAVLYSSNSKALGGLFSAIEPGKEINLSRLKESLKSGRYLQNDDMGQIYMGVELAKKLKITVGDNISFIGTGADYSFAADNLEVVGTFQTGLFDFDANSGFVTKKYFDLIMSADNLATHIVVRPKDISNNRSIAKQISLQIGPEYHTAPWQETLSSLVQAMKVDSIFGYITLSIIFMVIFFVIMIYTLLNVFSRIREIGILRAIGTSPSQIFSMLMLENIFLGLLGVFIGGIIGGSFAYYFQLNPITISGYEEQFKQYGLAASAMPSFFSPLLIFRDMLVMLVLTVCSSLYPILKIVRFQPIEAIHHV